jgi:hypothetical protein
MPFDPAIKVLLEHMKALGSGPLPSERDIISRRDDFNGLSAASATPPEPMSRAEAL